MNWSDLSFGAAWIVIASMIVALLLGLTGPKGERHRRANHVLGLIVVAVWPLAFNLLVSACLNDALKGGAHFRDGTPVSALTIERISQGMMGLWGIVVWRRYSPWSAARRRRP